MEGMELDCRRVGNVLPVGGKCYELKGDESCHKPESSNCAGYVDSM
jgi:hypothetical protein